MHTTKVAKRTINMGYIQLNNAQLVTSCVNEYMVSYFASN
jgi:hypothetical protein